MNFSTLIIIKPDDFPRLQSNYPRLVKNLPSDQLIFISSEPIREHLAKANLGEGVGFLDESSLLPFAEVHAYLSAHMSELLQGDELPRGATGWYYQQFLKMIYAYHCTDEYYMVWDGDTIPCKPISMFQEGSGAPYLDLKHEYHEEYFITLEKLLPGMKKCIQKSFISEHMLFHKGLMIQLIEAIEANASIPGETFWQKIISAIPPMNIAYSAFSEFETYGTFVCFTRPDLYQLREWHSFRLAGEFFDPNTICERDYTWLSKDFHAISFEKNHFVREDNRNLFDNPEYQKKLSARKMLEIAQEEFNGGYIEVWGDQGDALPLDPLAAERQEAIKRRESEDVFFEKLGDSLQETNPNQAFLCYENAHFLSRESARREALLQKLEQFKNTHTVTVAKAAICIVSYNCKEQMQKCLQSIRYTCAPTAYSLVITDNASTDGIAQWLEAHSENMTVLLSDENLGFPGGCNACIQYATPGQDIFLLNNDTQLTHNALFWLRMGLYAADNIGATGAIANYSGNEQMLPLQFSKVEDYLAFGEKNNVFMEHPYEEKSRLCGFAMLIRRTIIDEISGLDEAFSPGYFEDDDLSLEIRRRGYKLLVCHNSFIYHVGSQSFQKKKETETICQRNYEYIMKKWGFDCLSAATIFPYEKELLDALREMKVSKERLLLINCGTGNLLSLLHYTFPDLQLTGLESNKKALEYGIQELPMYVYDSGILTSAAPSDSAEELALGLPVPLGSFDLIVYSNRDELALDPAALLERLQPYLTPQGDFLYLNWNEDK